MLNQVQLTGRLTRDVELRYTEEGRAVARAVIAVDRNYTTDDGERRTDFIPVVMFGRVAEAVANHIGKGHLVAVEAELRSRRYETEGGESRWSLDVVANRVHFLAAPRRAGEAEDGAAAADEAESA